MAKSIKRVSICFALAIALVFTMMPMAAQSAKAAVSGTPLGAGNTLTLKQGVSTVIDFGKDLPYDAVCYFKINPTKTGIITLGGNTTYPISGYVSLCNASKKVISKDNKTSKGTWFWSESSTKYFRTVSFGVKKGKTYYIRIANCSPKYVYDGSVSQRIGTLVWTNSAVKGIKYGKTKKRAVALKKNKVRNGVFLAGSRKAQWYKISTKKTINRIILTANKNCGTIKATVYYKSYGRWTSRSIPGSRSGSYYFKRLSGKIKKAYVKVYPEYKSSGAYKLKWK